MERERSTIRLNCREVSRLLSDRQDESLPVAERARLRLHLVLCEACRNVSEQMEFVRRAVRQLDLERPDPDAPQDTDRRP